MPTPFEVMVAPFSVYTGPVNEARPDLEDAVAGNWTLLGLNGKDNYSEDGIVFTPEETIEEWFSLGSTGPQKAFRTQERVTVEVPIKDMTVETLAKIWNDASITEAAPGSGTAGVRDIDLLKGETVTEFGLLLRGDISPYIATAKIQFWLPRCYIMELGALTAVKGEPLGFNVTFAVLEHASNGFGKYEAQDEQGI